LNWEKISSDLKAEVLKLDDDGRPNQDKIASVIDAFENTITRGKANRIEILVAMSIYLEMHEKNCGFCLRAFEDPSGAEIAGMMGKTNEVY